MTCMNLDAIGRHYTIITTPEEYHAYQSLYKGTVLPLQHDGYTLGTTRNIILDYARAMGQTWIWMIDDDMQHMKRFKEGKRRLSSFRILESLEEKIQVLPITQAGLERPSNYPKQEKDRTWNVFCGGFTAIQVQKIGDIRYDGTTLFYEDVDFCLQLLLAGHCNVRFDHYTYVTPTCGTAIGGLYELYRSHTQEKHHSIMAMADKYGPEYMHFRMINGVSSIVTHWYKFSGQREAL